jgi:hypothetical protein
MENRIWITAGAIEAEAELNNTKTAQAIWQALPVKGRVSLWGDEIRPASPVNVFGKVIGDATISKKVAAGTRIAVRSRE